MDEINNLAYIKAAGQNDGNKKKLTKPKGKAFFENMADSLVALYSPHTVLDTGCGAGHLVAALRKRGVNAYGFDASPKAIAGAADDIKPYVFVHSLLENHLPKGLPQRFDLLTNIEVLEHLYEEDAEKALANLCRLSDKILFYSAFCNDLSPIHFHMHPPEHWARLFAKHGFFRPLRSPFVKELPDAQYFERDEALTMIDIAHRYETLLCQKKASTFYEEPYFTARVVFDCGAGFEEDTSLFKTQNESCINWCFSAANSATRFRLYLPAEKTAVVSNLQVTAEGQPLPLYFANGKTLYTGEHMLSSKDGLLISLRDLPCTLNNPTIHLTANVHPVSAKNPFYTFYETAKECNFTSEATLQAEHDDLCAELAAIQAKHFQLQYKRDVLQGHFENTHRIAEDYTHLYNSILHSSFWRITAPLRSITHGIDRGLSAMPALGKPYAHHKAKCALGKQQVAFHLSHYGNLYGTNCPFSPRMGEAQAQEKIEFDTPLQFSILCPLRNAADTHLREMLQSVLGQTYANWELCLVNAGSGAQKNVANIVQEFSSKDAQNRIRYTQISESSSLAEALNMAVNMANGDYFVLLEAEDVLSLSALFSMRQAIAGDKADFLYSDDYTFLDNDLSKIGEVRYKPDFAKHTLRSGFYIGNMMVFEKNLLKTEPALFRAECSGAEIYDLCLRLSESAQKITHVPRVLYFARGEKAPGSFVFSQSEEGQGSAQKALAEHLARCRLDGDVSCLATPKNSFKINYALQGNPLVSILIANKDAASTLRTCIESILQKSTYTNYEIIIVENGSTERATFALYEELQKDARVHILYWEKGFNYSAINNFAAKSANGEFILLLNNDMEVIAENWLQELLMLAQQNRVGAVGAKLLYPDNTVQHGGVVLGMGGVAAHSQCGEEASSCGYLNSLSIVRNVSVVTGACLMVRRSLYFELNGLDEQFVVAFNDVDFCMRLQEKGYLNLYTPFCLLYHYESKSRGHDFMNKEKLQRLSEEAAKMYSRWGREIQCGDPYYNPNLDVTTTEVRFKK